MSEYASATVGEGEPIAHQVDLTAISGIGTASVTSRGNPTNDRDQPLSHSTATNVADRQLPGNSQPGAGCRDPAITNWAASADGRIQECEKQLSETVAHLEQAKASLTFLKEQVEPDKTIRRVDEHVCGRINERVDPKHRFRVNQNIIPQSERNFF